MDELKSLFVGLAFGFLLHKAGLTRYERIVNVYRLSDLAVVEFMLAALVVGGLCVHALGALGLGVVPPLPATHVAANLLGGLFFGVGMSLTGLCPGTAVAAAGEGRLDSFVPGVLGFLAGALVHGLTYDLYAPALSRIGDLGRVTLASALGVDPWLVLVLLAEVVVLVLWLIRRSRRARRVEDDLGAHVDAEARAHS